jgi:predicted ATPase
MELSVKKNIQIIIETHSEHIIKAAQLEIARSLNYNKPIITKDNVSVLYVSKDEDGFSKVKQIQLDKTGAFEEPWPDDFFELSADLSIERLRNSIKSRN